MGEIKREEEMNKVNDTEDNSKTSNNSDSIPESSSSEFYSQGARPKVKNHISSKGRKASQSGVVIQNGSASQNEKFSPIQNGASCSSISTSSSSSSSLNRMISDIYEKNNVDHSVEKCLAKGRTLSSEDDLKYHDKKRKTGSLVDNESSSGNEGDEGLSGDDCCIYTYKGDQFADLPNSFFPGDMAPHEGDQPLRNNHRRERRPEEYDQSNPGSSPEMDYLEMDFDPGPSLEQDSEEDLDRVDGFNTKPINEPHLPHNDQTAVDNKEENQLRDSSVNFEQPQNCIEPQPGPSNVQCSPTNHSLVSNCVLNHFIRTKEDSNFCEESVQNHSCLSKESGNEEDKDRENHDSDQKIVNERLDKKLLVEKSDLFSFKNCESKMDQKTPFDGIMLWTEQEAISKQITLLSPDVSCGATAVINAMLVLKMRFSIDKVKEGISTRLKSESSSIPQYLVSRSFAGVAHENLIRGIHHASHGTVYARFFQMYPRRDVVLSRWLSYWMKKGAVPIATMNVQRDATLEDPSLDTRHHQMIFGVNSKGIYLTDPLECLEDEELWCRLVSPSVLKIKRSEIVSRWSPSTNLKPLMFQSDDRWKKMNVLGQVVNIIRESPDPAAQGKFLTQYISIPASSGITLVIPRDSTGYEELVLTADLPLLSQKSE